MYRRGRKLQFSGRRLLIGNVKSIITVEELLARAMMTSFFIKQLMIITVYISYYRLLHVSLTNMDHRLRGSTSPVVRVTSHFNGRLQNFTPHISQTP